MSGAKFVRPPLGTAFVSTGVAHIARILTADPDLEEEHEPGLWIKKRLDHLLLLEGLVLDARLVLSQLVDNNGLFALLYELCLDWVVWKEEADDASPYYRHRTRDPKHGSPLMLTGKETDSISDGSCETYTNVSCQCPMVREQYDQDLTSDQCT